MSFELIRTFHGNADKEPALQPTTLNLAKLSDLRKALQDIIDQGRASALAKDTNMTLSKIFEIAYGDDAPRNGTRAKIRRWLDKNTAQENEFVPA